MTANLVWLCFLGTHSQTAPMEAPPNSVLQCPQLKMPATCSHTCTIGEICKLRTIPIICKVQGSIQLSQGHTEQPKKLTQDRLCSHCPVSSAFPTPLVGHSQVLRVPSQPSKLYL